MVKYGIIEELKVFIEKGSLFRNEFFVYILVLKVIIYELGKN